MTLFRRETRDSGSGSIFFEPPISPIYLGPGAGAPGAPNVDRALQNDTVWACVGLMADIVSMLELQAFTKKGTVRTLLDPQPRLLLKPQDDADIGEWLWMIVVCLMLRGNAYAQIVARDFDGNVTQTELLNPDNVKPFRDPDTGHIRYRTGPTTVVERENMLHIKAYRWPGSLVGLSTIAYHALTINTDEAAGKFAYGFFVDAPHPTGALTSDQPINNRASTELKARFLSSVRGREPVVLGAGLKYQPLAIKPEESQFLATQKYTVAKIARIFRIPPEMVGGEAGNSMTYANVEQRSIQLLTYSAQPWIKRIERAVSSVLPGAKHVRFDVTELLRTDHETLARSTATRIASKQLTPDEARAMNDLPPLTAAQKKLLELVPLEVTAVGTPKTVPAGQDAAGGQGDEPEGSTSNGGQGS